MDGGISRLRRLGSDGRVAEIALPFDGTIGSVYTVPDEDGALISLGGWLTPTGIYSVDDGGRLLDTGITPRPAIDVSAYEAQALLRRREGRHENPLHPDLPQGPEARRQRADMDIRLRLLWPCGLHAGVRRTHRWR